MEPLIIKQKHEDLMLYAYKCLGQFPKSERMYDGRNKRHLYILIAILESVLDYLPLEGSDTRPIGEQMEFIVNQWITNWESGI